MDLKQVTFSASNVPTGIDLDRYDMSNVMKTTLVRSAFFQHEAGDKREDRFSHDASIKRYYERRDEKVEDSLKTIKSYNYLNPDAAIMLAIHKDFLVNANRKRMTIKLLKSKGIDDNEIEIIEKGIKDLTQYYEQMCLYAIEDLEEKTDTAIANVKEGFVIPCFPYVNFSTRGWEMPHVRITKIDSRSKYYALCTTIPQNSEDLVTKTFIGNCLNHLLFQIEKQENIEQVGTETGVYYDYLIKENAVLYLFINLQLFK